MSIYHDELRLRSLSAIPTGCDCVWTNVLDAEGRTIGGSIFIASHKCMRFLMHPRTWMADQGTSGRQEER